MALIKDGALVDDPWLTAPDGADLAPAVPQIISLERWQAADTGLRNRPGRLGIRLRSDQSPALVADDLGRFEVVALEFPKFTDGRGFSYARLLRERYAYRGEVRAVGNVLRDQFLFMLRCGFDAFEVDCDRPLEVWHEAVAEFGVWYQPTADGRIPAMVRRHRRLRAKLQERLPRAETDAATHRLGPAE
jgi:uncharacterized protein (DUF934 family)